ncbi:unnamed protein product, partial [Prorocentrum cordatum]
EGEGACPASGGALAGPPAAQQSGVNNRSPAGTGAGRYRPLWQKPALAGARSGRTALAKKPAPEGPVQSMAVLFSRSPPEPQRRRAPAAPIWRGGARAPRNDGQSAASSAPVRLKSEIQIIQFHPNSASN